MPEVRITAESRTEFGKGAARRLRRDAKVPAVVYGHGGETRHVALPDHELMLALKTSNVLLELQFSDGGRELVLPKSVQRDPVRHSLEHVDLVIVKRGEKVTVDVPVVVEGQVAPGGLLDLNATTVSLEAEATNIPQAVTVSVEGLEIGASVHAGELDLPTGATLIADPEMVVLHVMAAPTAAQIEETLAEETAEAEVLAEAPPVPIEE